MIGAASLALAAALAADAADAAPGWCERALPLVATPFDDDAAGTARLDAVIALLPAEAAPIAAQARSLAGVDGSLARAFEVAASAVREGCAPLSLESAAVSTRTQQLIDGDARFGGMREGDSLFDRLLRKAGLWLQRLFESSGMQIYASSARVVFLSLLAVVVVFVGVRLTRTILRTQRVRAAQSTDAAVVEARRRKAFAAWRAEAERALVAGDARTALRAGQAALLARVGELDTRAVTPARTHTEILVALRESVRSAVSPSLARFDRVFFGSDATVDDARAFLVDVDAAERRLRAPSEAT